MQVRKQQSKLNRLDPNRKRVKAVSEKAMATHSSTLARRIPGMEEAGGLLSMGSHRVGHI